MNWIDIAWPMVGAASLMLGVTHLLIWFRQRRQPAHLMFSLAAVAVSCLAIIEMLTMRAQDPGQYATLVRWGHLPVTVVIISLIGFVLLYFKAGRPAIALAACALRLAALAANFTTGDNLNFAAVTSLDQVRLWGGEVMTLPHGIPNPWMLLGQLSNLLTVVFLVDALATIRRRGNGEEFRSALLVCGSMALFIVLAGLLAVAVVLGWVSAPLTVSAAFLIVIIAMSYELGGNVIRAAHLGSQLEVSERGLRESEQRMQLAAHAAGLGMWTWDLHNKESWLSETSYALLGLSAGQRVTPDVFLSRVHSEDRQGVLQALDEAVQGTGEYSCEYRLPQPNGRTRWMAVDGRVEFSSAGAPRLVRGVILDITGRRQAEERFRRVIEYAPIAMLLVGGDGRIALTNAQAERLFGYSDEELLGQSIDILIPRSRDELFEEVAELATSSAGTIRLNPTQLLAHTKDGGAARVEVRLAPVQIAGDDFALASIVDLSELVRLEQESVLQRNELAHLSRVTLLGEMAGSIAHELNQPLTAVLSNAQAALRFLEREPPDLDELRGCLADIVDNDKRASEVIRRLRAMLRKDEVEFQVLAINEVVREGLRLIANDMLTRNVTLSLELGTDMPLIDGDRVQLQQVLLNLVINACDAMDQLDAPRTLTVRTQALAHHGVQVSVVDCGRGVDPDDLARIFSPFVTSKPEGIGLGLSICKTIIKAHAGSIWATNNEHGGATLHFQLPARVQPTASV